MAIFTSVILLAQNAGSTINENLQVTEDKLQNANKELDLLKEQYNNMLTQGTETTFFNFGNIYFWFVLVGLLLLAFGLLFLLAELQNKDRSRKSKVSATPLRHKASQGQEGGPASGWQSIKEEKEEENKVEEEDEEVEDDPEEDDEPTKGGPASSGEESELAKESEEEKIEEELVEEDDDEDEEEEEKPVKKMDKPIKIKVEKIK